METKMATRARVVEMEPPATTGGNALLVLVGLGVAFLLITALLGAAKSGDPLFNESNLLYVALIFYAGAGALYMGFGVTGVSKYVKFASIATVIGFTANTLAVAHRWYMAGRPPFASIRCERDGRGRAYGRTGRGELPAVPWDDGERGVCPAHPP
jgi:hypothetical protein